MNKIMQIKKEVQMREWGDMIKECRASGMSISDWCSVNSINIKTYYYRQQRVREYLCEQAEQPVQSQPPIVPISMPVEYSPQTIKITAGNISMDIPISVSMDMLNAIIEVLKC